MIDIVVIACSYTAFLNTQLSSTCKHLFIALSQPIGKQKRTRNCSKSPLTYLLKHRHFLGILPLTCSHKDNEFLGLITTRNKGLGARSAIKTTRSSHVESVVLMTMDHK